VQIPHSLMRRTNFRTSPNLLEFRHSIILVKNRHSECSLQLNLNRKEKKHCASSPVFFSWFCNIKENKLNSSESEVYHHLVKKKGRNVGSIQPRSMGEIGDQISDKSFYLPSYYTSL